MSANRLHDAIDDLEAEHEDLRALLSSLPAGAWAMLTAGGWSVQDHLSHLADTEEVARDTLIDGPRAFRRAIAAYESAEAFTEAGCERGRTLEPRDVLRWWAAVSAATVVVLRQADPDARVAWGLGMDVVTFAAARLMEQWAHSIDVRDAIGVPVVPTPRLVRVADLGYRTLPYALRRSRVTSPPDRTLRVELTDPDCKFGPDDATDLVAGTTLAWARLVVRRPASGCGSLTPHGPLADIAIECARAYL